MNRHIRYWYNYQPSPVIGYSLAVLLAVSAQLARLPLHPPTAMPYITYVPFVALSAALGGFGPGMLANGICLLESVYFASEPVGSFKVGDPRFWPGLGVLAFTGLVASLLFESLKRSWRLNAQITQELEMRTCMQASIVENSPTAIALLSGPEFRFVMVNPAYQALLPGESMLGRTVAEVWPAAAPLVTPFLKVVRDTQTPYHAEGWAIPRPATRGLPAEERYFDCSYIAVPGPGEGEVQVLVCTLDVTQRKRDETALRGAYAQLAAMNAQVPAVILVLDEQLHVAQANGTAAQFAGRDVADMPGLTLGVALGCVDGSSDPGDCGRTCDQCPMGRAVLDTLTSGTRHESIEIWLRAADGDRRCLVLSTAAVKDRTTRVLICAQDITQQKESEMELSRQHEELERQAALINLSHDAIITADANRVIVGWNRGAEEMYGWTEAEAVGHVIHVFLRSNSLVSMAQVDEILSRENEWDGEIEDSRKDGERILVDSRQVLLRNGSDIRILEINRDVTARRRAEEALNRTVRQLESALSEKTVLLQEIHHRVKNNLAVTASLLGMTADGCGPEARVALEESQQRVHSIALVHEHLYGCDHLDRIDFGQYAQELARGVLSSFSGEHCRIGLDFKLDPIEVGIERAVPCALILNELLSNAFKYAFADGRAGRVLVSFCQPEPGWFEMGVEDDGVGLPGGVLGGQEKSLGLRIVGILTRQLDGSIEQREGSGTRIVLRFPAAA